MSLASAARIAQSALNAVSVETSIVSRNISGANNTTYYSEKTANVISAYGGGAQVRSITNAQNQALFENVLTATSTGATQDALSAGLGQLNQTIGDTSGNTSPTALLSAFTNALQSYEASPTDSSLAQATVNAAQSLTSNLNNASATVANIREQADAQIGTSVSTINSLLSQFHNVNTLIVNGTATGADVTDLEDSRDQILKQLSQQIGITTTTSANNDMSIHTDSGVTLFQETARTVSFTPTNTFTASTNGNPVTVDGVPVTGPTGMPIQSGELAGLATLRDHIAVTYQSQLDEIARGLIDTFAESDQSGSATPSPTQPGLFTYSGAPTMPAASGLAGLAANIKVNANVDPSQGGDLNLLRDGGISDPSNHAYIYNTSGDSSYTGRLQQLLTGLSQVQTFNSSGGIETSDTLNGYANASISWLDATRQSVASASDYQSTLLSSATTALSNATGANLDNEMSKMLDLEQSYSASARLMSTINTMFSSLITAMNSMG